MTNLRALTVSLTKHGVHKIARLLVDYPRDKILEQLLHSTPGERVEEAQAKKTLAVGPGGAVPQLWDDVRPLGERAINSLVLIAIIFSHHELITAMSKARTESFRGIVKRGEVIDDKAYTNFARVVQQLGYSTFHHQQSFGYDLAPMFAIEGLYVPVRQLLELKIRAARWDGKGDLTSELVAQKFHEALAITADQFAHWLKDGRLSGPVELEDAAFFSGVSGLPAGGSFSFKSGHSPKKTGSVGVAPSAGDRTANLRHNATQTELYGQLVAKYGEGNVGTEVPTGDGTSIDVVVNKGTSCWFYEIKIADSLRACVRQSIPQLLEYAFWNCDDKRAEKLIIVAEFAPSEAAERYLAYLRTRFGLPIYYEQHTVKRS